jgi:uncharacterized membrane protein YphA (DoxX/SURF4 family)
MESSDTQAVAPDRARDQQREGERLEASAQTLSEAPWSTVHKVAFRFAFSYILLYLFPISITFGWLWGQNLAVYQLWEVPWHKIVPWFGAHVLHLSYPITMFPENSGGSDTTYDYVRVLCFVLISTVATIVWSVLDRKRSAYPMLQKWTHLYVRLVLAFTMFGYGLNKVIPNQMPPPSLSTLMTPFGDLTPYRLSWSFIGASPAYEIFAGVVETLGGILLLIPGMTMLGALVSLGALVNVFMLNMCYGIPVKFWALHLMLFAIFLLAPDIPRLVNLFILNRGAEPERSRPLFQRRWLNNLAWAMQWGLGIYMIAGGINQGMIFHRAIKTLPVNNPLYGIWKVDEFIADGQVRPPLLTDNVRWQRMIFPSTNTLTIQEMNGQLSPYSTEMNTQRKTLSLKTINTAAASSPWWSEFGGAMFHPLSSPFASGGTELNYDRPQPGAMIVEGAVNGHRVHVTLKKEERQFILTTRPFSWINDEYDLYSEHADEINRVR